MSQCVPSLDLDDNLTTTRVSLRSRSDSTIPGVPMLDYEVAELTWENGQLAMHGLGPRRVPAKTAATTNSASKYTWEKPRATGTLESIVNQATSLPNRKPPFDGGGRVELCPWFDQQRAAAAAGSITMTMDATVPCSNRMEDQSGHVMDPVPAGGMGLGGACMVDCSTRAGSCSGQAGTKEENVLGKLARVARVPAAPEWSGRDQSVSGSATFGRDSQRMSTHDTYDVEVGSMGSPENTSSAKPCPKAATTATDDDHDSICRSSPQRETGDDGNKKRGNGKSSISTKRSRAAAIHNQSERKRRDKINQRMKTLQKLVPNSSKTDKASMLDEVIEYLKQLQAQVQMMSRMNLPHVMLPMTMQQQLQMSLMAPMGMGMGMGIGMGVMDMNTMGRPNIPGIPSVISPTFMPMAASWDGSTGDRLQASPAAAVMADPLSFLACQSQPMTMDAYTRMAALYQQLQQPPPGSSSKS